MVGTFFRIHVICKMSISFRLIFISMSNPNFLNIFMTCFLILSVTDPLQFLEVISLSSLWRPVPSFVHNFRFFCCYLCSYQHTSFSAIIYTHCYIQCTSCIFLYPYSFIIKRKGFCFCRLLRNQFITDKMSFQFVYS